MSILFDADTQRELAKVLDVLVAADKHFSAQAQMNAALHLAREVRPAPLAVAVQGARYTLEVLLEGDLPPVSVLADRKIERRDV